MRSIAAKPPERVLRIRNQQRARPIEVHWLRAVLRAALEDELGRTAYELEVHLIGDAAMRRLNEHFARHSGTTDVLTFDYSQYPTHAGRRTKTGLPRALLRGECFISVPEAVRQAPRFGADWRTEIARYAIHGLLHLCSWNDHTAAARRNMKSMENRLMRAAARRAPRARPRPRARP